VPPSRPGVAPPRAASAGAAAIPYPAERVPLRLPVPAVPPFVQTPQRRYGELVALKWAGVLLILLAALTAFALIVRDIRSDPKSIPQPTAQLVIPAANGPSAGDAAAAIVPNPAFQGNVICLDAAHGGIDRGFRRTGDATAPAMDEALYTAAYARELAGQLTAMGFTVVLTRDGDTVRNTEFQDVNRDGQTRESGATDADAEHNALLDEMQARIDYCNDEKADLLIALHFEGSNDPDESGYATWYAEGRADSAESQRLAELIDQQLTQGLATVGAGTVDGGVQPESVAATRGNQMVYDSLFMITGSRDGLKDPSRMPGVVAELLTISNASDAQLLASEAGREAIVSALAQAIGAYFTGTTP
jgi:N-acetylmuramoyl-L-alanine amidase